MERRPGFRLAAEPEQRPAHPVVEPVTVGNGPEGLAEGVEGFLVAFEVVEGPGQLGPGPRQLLLCVPEQGRPTERLLERRQRRVVAPELELGRAEPDQRVGVVGIAVQGLLERLGARW